MLDNNLQVSENFKMNLLSAMSKTKSWLSIDDVQNILSEEQFQGLLDEKKNELIRFYSSINNPDITQDEIEDAIQDDIDRTMFGIDSDEKNGFMIQEVNLSINKLNRQINLNEIDAKMLAGIVEKAMQRHLDYDVFHSNKHLTSEQIPEVLRQYIDLSRAYQNGNYEIAVDEEKYEPREVAKDSVEAEVKKISSADIAEVDKENALTTTETNGFKRFWKKIMDKIRGIDKDEK